MTTHHATCPKCYALYIDSTLPEGDIKDGTTCLNIDEGGMCMGRLEWVDTYTGNKLTRVLRAGKFTMDQADKAVEAFKRVLYEGADPDTILSALEE